jgi:DNA-binding Lrp family transcriptional regulator
VENLTIVSISVEIPTSLSVAAVRMIMDIELDDIDRQLLDLVQANARYKAIGLASEVGVSDNTIHNRMSRLEEAGIITGYTTELDYDRLGLTFYFHFTCTTRISERAAVADRVMEIPEVVNVTELMTGHENLLVKAVGAVDEEITRIAEQIDKLQVEINDENLIRAEHSKPIDFSEIRLVESEG